MRIFRRYFWRSLLVIGVALGSVGLLQAGSFDLLPSWAQLADVSWTGFALYVALFALMHVVRAGRLAYLLKPLGNVRTLRVLSASFVGFAAIVLLPLRMGEVVRPVLLAKDEHVDVWQASGAVAGERVFDGLLVCVFLLAGMLLATPLDPIPNRIGDLAVSAAIIPAGAWTALGGFSGAMVILVLFYWRRAQARKYLELSVGRVSPRASEWLGTRLEGVAAGFGFLPRRDLLIRFTAWSVVYWGLNALATWVLARATGLAEFSYPMACVSMGVLALGILLPNAPGYFGAFQLAVFASLAMYFPPEYILSKGPSFVFLQFVVQNAVTALTGAWGVWQERGTSSWGLTGAMPLDSSQVTSPNSPGAKSAP